MPNIPWISVVIPTYSAVGFELTKTCIQSLKATHAHLNPEIIVVNDGNLAADEIAEMCEQNGAVFYGIERGGFAKACNVGLSQANGEMVFLVNNDIVFYENTLQVMADACNVLGAGVIGCKLIYPTKKVQHAGITFVPKNPKTDYPLPGWFDHIGRGLDEFHPDVVSMRISFVTGALLGISKAARYGVGLLDERFGFSCEDVDYNLRCLEAGLKPYYIGYTGAIHAEGATRGASPEEKVKLAPDVYEKEKKSLADLFDKWTGFDWKSIQV